MYSLLRRIGSSGAALQSVRSTLISKHGATAFVANHRRSASTNIIPDSQLTLERAEEILKSVAPSTPLTNEQVQQSLSQFTSRLLELMEKNPPSSSSDSVDETFPELPAAVIKVVDSQFAEIDEKEPNVRDVLHPENNSNYDAELAKDFEHFCFQLKDQPSVRPADLAPEEETVAEGVVRELNESPFSIYSSPMRIQKFLNQQIIQSKLPNANEQEEESSGKNEQGTEDDGRVDQIDQQEDDRFWLNFANLSMIGVIIFLITTTLHEESGDRREIASMRIRVKDYPWGDDNLLVPPHHGHEH